MSQSDFQKALEIGRPPNVRALFPNSRALIVSGKVIDRALMAQGHAMTIAANGRNQTIIRGALKAAQKAEAPIIIEIAKSEGTYCPVNYWNIAARVDQAMNELGITVPVAVHADHYGLKSARDVENAKAELLTMFEHGITSVAIDASHMPDEENLLANLALSEFIPGWSGYETEIGEIKGDQGLSTPAEALFLIQGLNAHGVFPDWIALNNGTTHGIEVTGGGIQVELTATIHEALAPYHMSGAQHGTSGNNSEKLRAIARQTRTTKANVATALQMIGWGVKVNEYGNAFLDDQGEFVKLQGKGVGDELWNDMVAYARKNGLKKGDYKKLNIHFESRMLAEPKAVREGMEQAVEEFVYDLLVNVFGARGAAAHGIEAILRAGSYDLGPKAERIEKPEDWTESLIRARAAKLGGDKGPAGDFDD